jgi:hypothetical protein
MKYITSLATLLLILNLAGCKNDAEKQMSDLTDKQKEVVSVLKSVTDKDSAKAADVKLKAIAKDMSAILERAKTTNPSADEQKRLIEKYKPEQEQAAKDIQTEAQRIGKIPGAGLELMDGLMEVGSVGMKARAR